MAKQRVTMQPGDISTAWGTALKNSVSKIGKGVDAVTESPMEKAANAKDKMRANFNAAMDSGRTEAALRASPLGEWKTKTKAKVTSNLSAGVEAAMPKRQRFDQYLVTTLNAVLPNIAGMPDQTLDDSVARVRALMQHMHDNPYKRGA